MTEDRKIETPGLAEVSPQFVHEAEAAVKTAVTQKAHDAIVAVLAKVPPRDENETQIEGVYRKLLALREYGPPRGRTDEEVAAWIDSHDGLEEEIGTLRAENLRDVEIKMAVLYDRIRLNLAPGEQPVGGDLLIAQTARDDLRRIAEESRIAKIAQPDTALSALWQEWQRLWEANRQAVEDAQDDELASEIFEALMTVEKRMENMPARTAAGVLNKLQVASVWIDTNQGSKDKMGVTERLTLSALGDLERLTGQGFVAVPKVEDPVIALKREWKARWGRYKNDPDDDDELTTALGERVDEAHHAIIRTPATTIAGVAVKLAIWARGTTPGHATEDWWKEPLSESCELEFAPVASALQDLERLARTTTVAEAPPAEDAALFDALAEYDRLAAIEQDLERRKEVFRSGIPEAEEANKAYEAAYDEAMKAWATARDIPATTQAGLFAKLQEAVRFMADLGEDELYEAEWRAIKADVRQMAG